MHLLRTLTAAAAAVVLLTSTVSHAGPGVLEALLVPVKQTENGTAPVPAETLQAFQGRSLNDIKSIAAWLNADENKGMFVELKLDATTVAAIQASPVKDLAIKDLDLRYTLDGERSNPLGVSPGNALKALKGLDGITLGGLTTLAAHDTSGNKVELWKMGTFHFQRHEEK